MRLDALIALCSAAVAASGCIPPITAASAYESVEYHCDDHANVIEARIDACLASPTCAGYFDLVGTLEGNDVVVDAPLSSTVFEIVIDPMTSVQQIDKAVGSGAATHFFFQLSIDSIGTHDDVASTVSQPYEFDSSAATLPDEIDDEVADLELRVTAQGESQVFGPATGSGNLVLDHPQRGQLEGTFSGDFGSAKEPLRGCFLFVAGERRIVGSN